MSQNLTSAAVEIGALRVKYIMEDSILIVSMCIGESISS